METRGETYLSLKESKLGAFQIIRVSYKKSLFMTSIGQCKHLITKHLLIFLQMTFLPVEPQGPDVILAQNAILPHFAFLSLNLS